MSNSDVRSLASVSVDALEETRGACSWLHGIATESEARGSAPPGVAEWLENLGMHCAAELQHRGLFPAGALQ